MSSPVAVYLWGLRIGALSYGPNDPLTAVFEYSPEFVGSGIQLAPLTMPLRTGTFRFPDISINSFNGLPGMLADSLPDRFGNQLIDSFLATKGIPPERITAIDRLHFVGSRGMGALEYRPSDDLGIGGGGPDGGPRLGGVLDLAELTELANVVVPRSDAISEKLEKASSRQAAFDLLRVGSSAGGARAKALIALDADGNPGLGHLNHGLNHSYWILKFDGIDENKDRGRADPPGSTVLEYIYSLIADACGISMSAYGRWRIPPFHD